MYMRPYAYVLRIYDKKRYAYLCKSPEQRKYTWYMNLLFTDKSESGGRNRAKQQEIRNTINLVT